VKKGLSLRNLIRKLQQRRSLKIHWRIQRSGGKNRRRAPGLLRPVWPVWRPVWPVDLEFLERIPETRKKKKGRVLKNSWPNMRIKESSRSRGNDRTKSRIQIRHRPKSNRVWAKVIHLMDRLLHGIAGILVICLWIIVGCTCSHIIFIILLYIQALLHKDRLAIIWSKRTLIAARSVRRT